MPIANCFIARERFDEALLAADDLIALWSAHAGESSGHMTINCLQIELQRGVRYPVMAWLYLPSLWPPASVRRLQCGLASALAQVMKLDGREIQVITTIIESGLVVEDGDTQQW